MPAQKIPEYTSDIIADTKSEVEIGCRSDGYVKVRYTGEKKWVVQILYETNKNKFDYYCTGNDWVNIPLQCGDGNYTVRVMENTHDNMYAQTQRVDTQVTYKSVFSPFLVPNAQVNYTTDGKTAKKARELAAGADNDLDRARAIFTYIVNNYVYDNDKAELVRAKKLPNYVPVVDTILDAKKGICYDYAALYAAMLRTVGIPAKLIKGYVNDMSGGQAYHAWNEVFISGTGWIKVNGEFYFDGKKYTRMDSTWAAANKSGYYTEFFKKDSNYVVAEAF